MNTDYGAARIQSRKKNHKFGDQNNFNILSKVITYKKRPVFILNNDNLQEQSHRIQCLYLMLLSEIAAVNKMTSGFNHFPIS